MQHAVIKHTKQNEVIGAEKMQVHNCAALVKLLGIKSICFISDWRRTRPQSFQFSLWEVNWDEIPQDKSEDDFYREER